MNKSELDKLLTIMTARIMALESVIEELDPFLAHRAKQFVVENTRMLVQGIAKEDSDLAHKPVDPS